MKSSRYFLEAEAQQTYSDPWDRSEFRSRSRVADSEHEHRPHFLTSSLLKTSLEQHSIGSGDGIPYKTRQEMKSNKSTEYPTAYFAVQAFATVGDS